MSLTRSLGKKSLREGWGPLDGFGLHYGATAESPESRRARPREQEIGQLQARRGPGTPGNTGLFSPSNKHPSATGQGVSLLWVSLY